MSKWIALLTLSVVDFRCSCSGNHLLSQLKKICRVRMAWHSSCTGLVSKRYDDFGSRRNWGCSINGCILSKQSHLEQLLRQCRWCMDVDECSCSFSFSLALCGREKEGKRTRRQRRSPSLSPLLSCLIALYWYCAQRRCNFQVILEINTSTCSLNRSHYLEADVRDRSLSETLAQTHTYTHAKDYELRVCYLRRTRARVNN